MSQSNLFGDDQIPDQHLIIKKQSTQKLTKKQREFNKLIKELELQRELSEITLGPVSYTHLDVYKRQTLHSEWRSQSSEQNTNTANDGNVARYGIDLYYHPDQVTGYQYSSGISDRRLVG